MKKQMKALFLIGVLLVVGLTLIFGCSAKLTKEENALLEDSLKAPSEVKVSVEKADQAADKAEAAAMDAEAAARRSESAADASDQAAQKAEIMNEKCQRIFDEAMK